jgi:hypothetical protein
MDHAGKNFDRGKTRRMPMTSGTKNRSSPKLAVKSAPIPMFRLTTIVNLPLSQA